MIQVETVPEKTLIHSHNVVNKVIKLTSSTFSVF